MTDRFLYAGALRFHVVEEGPPGAPLVLLLHGFPEFWYSWRRQIPALAEAGFRVVAPDQRGYHLSDKPPRVRDYDIDLLAGDVAVLIAALGADRASVVGHDWGGAVAWQLAARHPAVVERLCVMACPHPRLMARALLRSRAQRRRSRYMFLFQVPLLPERVLGGERLRCRLRRWAGDPAVYTDEDLDRYVEAFERPGAMRSALHWYRAALLRWRRTATGPAVHVGCTTLVLWGERDPILGTELIEGTGRLVDGPFRAEVLPGLGHFLHEQAPDEVNRRLLDFLRSPLPGGSAR